mgnify:CR=1 FL=1
MWSSDRVSQPPPQKGRSALESVTLEGPFCAPLALPLRLPTLLIVFVSAAKRTLLLWNTRRHCSFLCISQIPFYSCR